MPSKKGDFRFKKIQSGRQAGQGGEKGLEKRRAQYGLRFFSRPRSHSLFFLFFFRFDPLGFFF